VIEECTFSSNGLNGVLLAENAHLMLKGSRISNNGGFGVFVKDGIADIDGNIFSENSRGPWSASANADIDLDALSETNRTAG